MVQNLGWTLQLVALAVVGSALPVGVYYGALRTEIGLLGAGGALFLFGRWLAAKDRR